MSVSITFALSFGPNDIAKRPHPEARPARMRMRKRPFHNAIRAGKAPFRGGGGRWWIGDLKKRNAYALLLPMQRYDILRPIANQR